MISLIAIFGLLCIIIGTSLVSSSLKIRRRYTYPLLIIGGICLLAYSIYLKDTIFIILQAVFIISSLIGLIKINEKYLRSQIKNIRRKK
jgi:lipid-A-disaccharide synthase-like uncharacterized protein